MCEHHDDVVVEFGIRNHEDHDWANRFWALVHVEDDQLIDIRVNTERREPQPS